MNLNDNVKVLMLAKIDQSEMNRLICNLACEVVDGKRTALPDDYADLFTLEIVTRPSGSRYAVVNFA